MKKTHEETHIEQARRELKDPAGIQDRICPQCGKRFTCWSLDAWVYKSSSMVFCTWTCYRENGRGVKPHPGRKAAAVMEAATEERRKRQHANRPAALESTRQIIARKERGMSNKEIAEDLGITVSVVAQRLTKYGRELGWVPMTKREAGLAGLERRREKAKSRAEE